MCLGETGEICSICLETNTSAQLICGHYFHGYCLVELIRITFIHFCKKYSVESIIFAYSIGFRCPNCRGRFQAYRSSDSKVIENRRWFLENTSIVFVLATLSKGFMLIVADHMSEEGCFINLSSYSKPVEFDDTCNTIALKYK